MYSRQAIKHAKSPKVYHLDDCTVIVIEVTTSCNSLYQKEVTLTNECRLREIFVSELIVTIWYLGSILHNGETDRQIESKPY